ncbi:hypothetical protein NVV95_14670 [Herbiconiux sp. CPCC 205716]|uniref:Uncharacterized protein n=1 Tax=Herbiconiux gentiana TaxID=2970912 RepID=A0ABT2GHU4_9MICO|nr:hypothetical protein [Herbiconiux gentiana]MCS5715792.1 hypothetical protein [Herbiconiux gentiana]
MTEARASGTPAEAANDGKAARIAGVIVVGMCAAVWWPAFTLGAWGDFFFDQLLTIWAAATGAFFVVVLFGRGRRRWWRAAALLAPSLYLAANFVVQPEASDVATLVVAVLGALVAVLAVPTTVWVLARIIWPEFGEEVSPRRRVVVIGVVAFVAVTSFLLGANQAHFMTCGEFTLSGNSEPPGCTPDSVYEE